jgi:hypothetical protein
MNGFWRISVERLEHRILGVMAVQVFLGSGLEWANPHATVAETRRQVKNWLSLLGNLKDLLADARLLKLRQAERRG